MQSARDKLAAFDALNEQGPTLVELETLETNQCSDEDAYRNLIKYELANQQKSSTEIAEALKINRSTAYRILAGRIRLTAQRREAIFKYLQIDPIRAYAAVVLYKDIAAYDDLNTIALAQFVDVFSDEMHHVRNGRVKIRVKTSIVRQAALKSVDALLKHQERVLEFEKSLFD